MCLPLYEGFEASTAVRLIFDVAKDDSRMRGCQRTIWPEDYYLPQLSQVALLRYNKSSLHRFLLDKASSRKRTEGKLSRIRGDTFTICNHDVLVLE